MSSESSPPYSYSLTLILVGIVSSIGLWYLALHTFIPIDHITLLVLAISVLSFALHYIAMPRIRTMHALPQAGLYLVGYGITGAALFLLLNFSIHGAAAPKEIMLKSEIKETDEHSYLDVSSGDAELERYHYILNDNTDNLEGIPESITLSIAEGIFGYKIVVDKSYRYTQERGK